MTYNHAEYQKKYDAAKKKCDKLNSDILGGEVSNAIQTLDQADPEYLSFIYSALSVKTEDELEKVGLTQEVLRRLHSDGYIGYRKNKFPFKLKDKIFEFIKPETLRENWLHITHMARRSFVQNKAIPCLYDLFNYHNFKFIKDVNSQDFDIEEFKGGIDKNKILIKKKLLDNRIFAISSLLCEKGGYIGKELKAFFEKEGKKNQTLKHKIPKLDSNGEPIMKIQKLRQLKKDPSTNKLPFIYVDEVVLVIGKKLFYSDELLTHLSNNDLKAIKREFIEYGVTFIDMEINKISDTEYHICDADMGENYLVFYHRYYGSAKVSSVVPRTKQVKQFIREFETIEKLSPVYEIKTIRTKIVTPGVMVIDTNTLCPMGLDKEECEEHWKFREGLDRYAHKDFTFNGETIRFMLSRNYMGVYYDFKNWNIYSEKEEIIKWNKHFSFTYAELLDKLDDVIPIIKEAALNKPESAAAWRKVKGFEWLDNRSYFTSSFGFIPLFSRSFTGLAHKVRTNRRRDE